MAVLRFLIVFLLLFIHNSQLLQSNLSRFDSLYDEYNKNVGKCLKVTQPTQLSNCSDHGKFCCLMSTDSNSSIKSCFAMKDYHFFNGLIDFTQNGTTITINCSSVFISVTLIFLIFIF